jgi:hypothetical protein
MKKDDEIGRKRNEDDGGRKKKRKEHTLLPLLPLICPGWMKRGEMNNETWFKCKRPLIS